MLNSKTSGNRICRGMILLVVLSLLLGLCLGCGTTVTTTTQPTTTKSGTTAAGTTAAGTTAKAVVNKTNLAGLPIAAEPITFKVAVGKSSSSYQGEWEKLDWIKKLQSESGITLQFSVWNSADELNLIFASRDYPDLMFGGASDNQILDASMAGDIYQLDELINKYAPNWKSYLAENDYCRKVVTLSDGHIWALPIVRDEPSNGNLRDQWLITKTWLDELNLKVPTTTDEFYNVLKAFKDNAGKGTIPAKIIPYYVYGTINNVGGILDMINTFGVRVANERGLVTVDDKGKVEFNYSNEAIKEPLEYMHKLFAEGLIAGECLTDDWDTYLTKTRSNPYIVGSYHSYQNPDATNTKIVAMGPLDAKNGKTRMIRSQTNQVQRNSFIVFKKNKYPEASIRLADLIADKDWSIQAMYGMFGDTYLKKNTDGSVTMLPYPADAQGATSAPMNRVCFLLTSKMFEKFSYAAGSAQGQRADAIKNVYAKYSIPSKNLYPNVVFTSAQTAKRAALQTDINDYVKNTLATWLLKGGINEGWADYVSQLKKIGLDEYLKIMQDALDTFNKN